MNLPLHKFKGTTKSLEKGNAKQQQLKYSLRDYYLLQEFRLPFTCMVTLNVQQDTST